MRRQAQRGRRTNPDRIVPGTVTLEFEADTNERLRGEPSTHTHRTGTGRHTQQRTAPYARLGDTAIGAHLRQQPGMRPMQESPGTHYAVNANQQSNVNHPPDISHAHQHGPLEQPRHRFMYGHPSQPEDLDVGAHRRVPFNPDHSHDTRTPQYSRDPTPYGAGLTQSLTTRIDREELRQAVASILRSPSFAPLLPQSVSRSPAPTNAPPGLHWSSANENASQLADPRPHAPHVLTQNTSSTPYTAPRHGHEYIHPPTNIPTAEQPAVQRTTPIHSHTQPGVVNTSSTTFNSRNDHIHGRPRQIEYLPASRVPPLETLPPLQPPATQQDLIMWPSRVASLADNGHPEAENTERMEAVRPLVLRIQDMSLTLSEMTFLERVLHDQIAAMFNAHALAATELAGPSNLNLPENMVDAPRSPGPLPNLYDSPIMNWSERRHQSPVPELEFVHRNENRDPPPLN